MKGVDFQKEFTQNKCTAFIEMFFLKKCRFVEEDHIPYINAFKLFPEEMKVYGRDKGIFAIEVGYILLCIAVTNMSALQLFLCSLVQYLILQFSNMSKI